jgi:hypothetical protein
MKRKVLKGMAVVVALAMAVSVMGPVAYAQTKHRPELIIVGPTSIKVEAKETIVLRGVMIKGQGKDTNLYFKVSVDDRNIVPVLGHAINHGNMASIEVTLKAKHRPKPGVRTMTVTLYAKSKKGTKIKPVTKEISLIFQ